MKTKTQIQMHHQIELLKQFLTVISHAVWNDVNALNIAVGVGAVYAQILILIGVSDKSTELAWWIQVGFGIAVSISLITFNVVRTYLMWKKKDNDEE